MYSSFRFSLAVQSLVTFDGRLPRFIRRHQLKDVLSRCSHQKGNFFKRVILSQLGHSLPLLEPLVGHGLWLVAEFAEMSFHYGGSDFVFGGQFLHGCFGIQKISFVLGGQRDLLATSTPLPFDAEFL